MAPQITCSFCFRDQKQVDKLISGPNDNVYICNECIDICAETIHNASYKNKEPKMDTTEEKVYCLTLQNYDSGSISDMVDWLETNVKNSWVNTYEDPKFKTKTYKILFESESDLVAFKLRWA